MVGAARPTTTTQITSAIAERYEVDLEAPWEDLPEEERDLFLYGTNGDRIYITYRNRYGRKRSYAHPLRGHHPQPRAPLPRDGLRVRRREKIEEYMSVRPCPECDGARLRPESRAVTVVGG